MAVSVCVCVLAGDVTTLNLTVLKAGVSVDGGDTYAFNVIPNQAEAGFDIRIPPAVPSSSIVDMLNTWCVLAGGGSVRLVLLRVIFFAVLP